jgi:hypothetical protein
MVFLFFGQLPEDSSPARVLGHPCRPGIEVKAAPLGCDRNPQCIAGEEQFRHAPLGEWRPTGSARVAGAVDLENALTRSESARRGNLLDQRLDVRAEEFERPAAGPADQVKVARMPVRMLEAETPLAKIDLARNAGIDHPLQGAVNGRPADALVGSSYQLDEVVGGEVSLLPEEYIDDEIPFARALAAGGPKVFEEGGS